MGGSGTLLNLPGMETVCQRRTTGCKSATRLLCGIRPCGFVTEVVVVVVVVVLVVRRCRDMTTKSPMGMCRTLVSACHGKLQWNEAYSGPVSGSEALSGWSTARDSDSDPARSSLSLSAE